jgi:hypothetical protein
MAAKPTPPSQSYSFTDHSISFPSTPQPGDRLDSELDALRTFAAQVTAWASTAIADDGTIKAGVIGTVNLDPSLVQGIVDDVESEVQPLVNDAQVAAGLAEAAKVAAEAARDTTQGYVGTVQGAANAASAAAAAAATSQDNCVQILSETSGYATQAESNASYMAAQIPALNGWRNDTIMFAEYMAGPVWTSEQYALIDPSELPPGFAYQPVDGLPAGLHSAKWWAVQAMQIVEAMQTDFLLRTGGTLTGALTLVGDPTDPLHAATKQYADTKVAKSGDTMTGWLTLHSSSPTQALHAASKGYVDTALSAAIGGTYLPLSGGTMTGFITAHTDYPTADRHAATKKYVDTMVAAGGLNPLVYVAKAGDTMTGALGVIPGTVGAPGLNFSGDTDTGLYSVSSNTFGLAASGQSVAVAYPGVFAVGADYSGAAPAGMSYALRVSALSSAAGVGVLRYTADANGPTLGLYKSRGTSYGTEVEPLLNDVLGVITFTGWDGDSVYQASQIRAIAAENWTTSLGGSCLLFYTTPTGGQALSERMRIDGTGNLCVGTTSSGGYRMRVGGASTTISAYYAADDASGPNLAFQKYRGSGINLAYLDDIGVIDFLAINASGTSQRAASIFGEADGAHGTGSSPGRLSFNTTPSGSTTALRRMQIRGDGTVYFQPDGTNVIWTITSTGQLLQSASIGGSEGSVIRLYSGLASSSAYQYLVHASTPVMPTAAVTTVYGANYLPQLQSSSSNVGSAVAVHARVDTLASYTGALTTITGVQVGGASVAGTQPVTNFYGVDVSDNSGAATNSYGVIARQSAGTNKWNLYCVGTAANYMAGALGIGTTSLTGARLVVAGNLTGATTAIAGLVNPTVQSDVTASHGIRSELITAAASFTLSSHAHFRARQSSIGAGSAVTSQYGFWADNTLTGGTNNYGFVGEIPAATGAWNLYMNGTANNYLAGALGIGSTVLTGMSLRVSKALTGATDVFGVLSSGTIQSDATTSAKMFNSQVYTQAASFTCGYVYHFVADQGALGAGSAITNQYGFAVSNSLTGGTKNYGFYGNLSAGTGRWNLHMDGTAQNFILGNLGIGSGKTVPGYAVDVAGTVSTENLRITKLAYYDEVYDNGNSGTSKTIDWTNGNKQKVTMTGNCTFTFTAPTGPCEGKLVMKQDATGGRTTTFPTMKKLDGSAFVFNTAANATNILSWFYDGTNYYGAVASFS